MFIEKFKMKNWDNQEIVLDDLKSFLDIDLTGVNFWLCGNTGDPIYYSDLYNLVSWIKEKKGTIVLTTNGSYRTKAWWDQHVALFDSNDEIVFSIDGTPDNFTNYRVNGDWDSILIGIESAVKSKAKTTWKYIPFSFNEHTVQIAEALSKELGMDSFQVSPSERWDENDKLKPADIRLQSTHTKKLVNVKQSDVKYGLTLNCHDNRHHFISSAGYYAPCCFSADWRFYYSSKFYKNKEAYDISKTTISQILAQEQTFFETLETEMPKYCVFNCLKTL